LEPRLGADWHRGVRLDLIGYCPAGATSCVGQSRIAQRGDSNDYTALTKMLRMDHRATFGLNFGARETELGEMAR
jgi:hypothetical protein